jgi:hypothetical protein
MLVLGGQSRAVVCKIQDDGSWIADHHEPGWPDRIRVRAWRILFTDYRRPLETFLFSFRAAIGLYFFKETFA